MSKTILITGASNGFGRDTTETLLRAGYTAYVSMRGAQGKNRQAAETLRKLGIKIVELDASDDAAVEAGVNKVLLEGGKIDVLVNNAGIAFGRRNRSFHRGAGEGHVRYECHRATSGHPRDAPPMCQKRDGLIINIGSIPGRVTFPFLGINGASKMVVVALTDNLRYEVSQLGVRVVKVQPSGYPTNFFTSIRKPAGTEVTKSYGEVGQIPDAMFKTFMSRFEGKDAPNPHDVAEAVAKLVQGSGAARTVVGAAFGSDKITEDVAPVQAKVFEALDLSHLEKIA